METSVVTQLPAPLKKMITLIRNLLLLLEIYPQFGQNYEPFAKEFYNHQLEFEIEIRSFMEQFERKTRCIGPCKFLVVKKL